MQWLSTKMTLAGLWLRSLPFWPHLGRCPYCGPDQTTQATLCREFYRIAYDLEGANNTRLETYRKWSKLELEKEHERIIALEDRLNELRWKQPSSAAEKLRNQMRYCEVIVRNELPPATDEDWQNYALRKSN